MKRILLVEDDTTMLSLLTTLLKLEGFEILPLGDDSEAGILMTVCTSLPDIVLMDVNLRRANGLDVMHRITQHPDCQGVRVLMSSGMDYRQDCLKAGADQFILKPYMPDDLIQQLNALMAVEKE